MTRAALSVAYQLLLIAVSFCFFCISELFKLIATPPIKISKAAALASEFFDEKSREVAAREFGRRAQ